jgi:peptidyl-dipeptidase Dcp
MHLTNKRPSHWYHIVLAKSQGRLDFTLDYPSYVPFVTYADNRSYVKDGYCFGAKGFQNNELTTNKMFLKLQTAF